MIRLLIFFFLFSFLQSASFANDIIDKKLLLSQDQEDRAYNLFLQVKCLICEGQVIESSDAEIAVQMRKFIKKKIYQGLSDEEIKSYLVKNYGADIINSPQVNHKTIFLWILPTIFFIIGFILMAKRFIDNSYKRFFCK